MTFVVQKELKEMLRKPEGICLSIYMPIISPGKGDEENRIRFKNMIQKSELLLSESGLKNNEINSLLKEARNISEDPVFFRNQEKGFALFINAVQTNYFFLPYIVAENVTAGNQFLMAPLLPSFYGDGQYFILGVTKDHARLFSGSKQSLFEVDISEAVSEAKKQMDLIQTEKSLDHHSVSPAGGGPGAIFHGKDDSEFQKELIRQFFRLIDDGISTFVNKHRYPMVLCGVDYLLPIYRDLTKYPNLLNKGITGNPDDFETKILHQKSWAIVEELFLKELHEDLEAFHTRKGTGNTSVDLKEISEKSAFGQVKSLFISITDAPIIDHSDPLNLSVINTIQHNGQVYGIPSGTIDPGISVAALFRF